LMSSLEPKLDDQSVSIRRYLWSSAPSFIEIKTTHRVVWKSACYYMVKIKIRHSTCWIAARDDESLRWEKKSWFWFSLWVCASLKFGIHTLLEALLEVSVKKLGRSDGVSDGQGGTYGYGCWFFGCPKI
jgi:hypothetical protein